MRKTVVDHPLAVERLTVLRDAGTERGTFRQALDGLAGMLVYEATKDLPVDRVEIDTPLQRTTGVRLNAQPLVVPVLRAGLGMLEAARRLLPSAEVGFVGVSRNEETFAPSPYLSSLPERLDGRFILVLDPMLATGGSLLHTCQLLHQRGAGPMTIACVLAAPEGLEKLEASGLELHVVTAAIDDHLNEKAYILPGLGDAGDRQFGPD